MTLRAGRTDWCASRSAPDAIVENAQTYRSSVTLSRIIFLFIGSLHNRTDGT
jgi:hypothetical protein